VVPLEEAALVRAAEVFCSIIRLGAIIEVATFGFCRAMKRAMARQAEVEIGVDKNTVVVFPAPLMSTIGELGAFLARESEASAAHGRLDAPRSSMAESMAGLA
jgi:hypothetical protein